MNKEISGEQHRELLNQKASAKNNKRNYVAIALIGLVILGAVSILEINQHRKQQQLLTANRNRMPSNGFGNFNGGNRQPRGMFGKVTAVSATSISVMDLRSSSIKSMSITSSTQVNNSNQAATIADIKVDDNVLILPNATNAQQADRIILNPPTRGMRGNGPPNPQSTDSSPNTQLN